MDDVEAPEAPNTLARLVAKEPLDLQVLESLGLMRLVGTDGRERTLRGSSGRSRIVHPGADTYLGHQEMMGTIPGAPQPALVEAIGPVILKALAARRLPGAWERIPGVGNVIVSGSVIVADNIEAAPGMNINITGSLDEVGFDDLLAVGEVVRSVTSVTRVIVVGGKGFTRQDILAAVRRHEGGHVGVDTPALGVYDENYRVRHIGLPVPIQHQVPSLAKAAGLFVALIGKAADVIHCEDADIVDPLIITDGVFDRLEEVLASVSTGLIVANVQETDLAGHEQDVDRYRWTMARVDERLGGLIDGLGAGDLVIVTADHGNDPGSGSSQHTREYVPVLAYAKHQPVIDLGTRKTLADVGATLSAWLGIQLPANGEMMFADGDGR